MPMNDDLLDKFLGTLFGVAIGDTLGRPFEGVLRDGIHSQFNDFEEFVNINRHLLKTYTDDTQLTLHTAQALINGNGYNEESFVDEFVAWLDDPPIGPGFGCISSIRELKNGVNPRIAASNSGGNGTAMRVSPIGLYYCKDFKQLKEAAIRSSEITHNHPAAAVGAVIIARAVAYLLYKNPEEGFSTKNFFDTIISSIANSQDEIWKEFVGILRKVESNLNMTVETGLIKFSQAGVKAPYFIEDYLGLAFVHPYTLSTVACSIFVFLKRLKSFKECIFELPTSGGDSDTIGAIGGSLAGAYFGMKNIPKDLIKLVKNNKKIQKLGETLYNKFKEKY